MRLYFYTSLSGSRCVTYFQWKKEFFFTLSFTKHIHLFPGSPLLLERVVIFLCLIICQNTLYFIYTLYYDYNFPCLCCCSACQVLIFLRKVKERKCVAVISSWIHDQLSAFQTNSIASVVMLTVQYTVYNILHFNKLNKTTAFHTMPTMYSCIHTHRVKEIKQSHCETSSNLIHS